MTEPITQPSHPVTIERLLDGKVVGGADTVEHAIPLAAAAAVVIASRGVPSEEGVVVRENDIVVCQIGGV